MAVIAKFDCRVFCHINSLEDKISNTAATIQPNPFWFWENIIYILLGGPDNSGTRNHHLAIVYMKLALVMASASFLPHEKMSIREKVLDDQKFE